LVFLSFLPTLWLRDTGGRGRHGHAGGGTADVTASEWHGGCAGHNLRAAAACTAAIVVFSTLAFGKLILFQDELIQVGRNAIAGTLFVANFSSWSEAGYFDLPSTTKPLLHLWSLGVEEQFYLIWPILIWVARKSNKKIFLGMLIVVLISFLLNVITIQTNSTAAFYSPLTRIWELASGGILAHVINRNRILASTSDLLDQQEILSNRLTVKIMKSKSLRNALGLVGILLIIWGAFAIKSETAFPGVWALIPVVGTILIIFSTHGESHLKLFLGSRFFVAIGLISYPLYLWHWPILVYTRMFFGQNTSVLHLIFAIFAATFFAWLTFVFVEKPIKRNTLSLSKKSAILSAIMVGVLIVGIQFSGVFRLGNPTSTNSKQSSTPTLIEETFIEKESPIIKRRGTEGLVGKSLSWFQGTDNWLFLGNAYSATIDKLTLRIVPAQETVETTALTFDRLASTGDLFGTRVALLIGPSKPSVYSEYLPSQVVISKKRYINFFVDRLSKIDNLLVYDPTDDFIESKNQTGLLYSRTDTHWNTKGAYVAYEQFLQKLGIPAPLVEFKAAPAIQGDLVKLSGLKDFPVEVGDNWEIIWKSGKNWNVEVNEKSGSSNNRSISRNEKALSNKNVWVIGDSFAEAVNPYVFATFKKVTYLGNWRDNIGALPEKLKEAEVKPDLVIIIRTERDF
jgi:peptidoglycan/LPS O-acetylase OafA/YrhL